MSILLDSVIVVIRASNERTFDLCKSLCSAQWNKSLSTVQEVPFEAALRKCYEIGVASNKKWMVTVDADVLLVDGAILTLVNQAEKMPQNFIQLEGRIFDKITGMYRQAGHRIYRTKLLPLALNHIPTEGSQIRPEYCTLQQMGKLGHPSRRIPNVVGLHDFEQSYFDIYRKSFVHAIKHPNLIKDLIERCVKNLHEDTDYLVILKGLWDGMTANDSVSIDRRKFYGHWEKALKTLGIEEKPSVDNVELFVSEFSGLFERVTNQYPIPDFGVQDDPNVEVMESNNWRTGVHSRISTHGVVRGSIAVLGGFLGRIARFLDK